ncbi:hypothetical protein [Leisingera sp. JC11]|uniref:hypothetical protein n=1 Tax=Leisingera sp. JC11 TaxID=3042469 RepID=UPI003452BC30
MKLRNIFAAGCLLLSSPLLANAQEQEGVWVTYYLKAETNAVTGLMQIAVKDGKEAIPASYSMNRIERFISEDCAGGKVGPITLGKQKTKRKWKFIRQEFETTCSGGPHSSIPTTTGRVQVQVKRQADGRDLAEYFYGQNGNMVTTTRYR